MTDTVVSGLMPDQIIYYQDQLEKLIEKPLQRMGADKHYSVKDVLQKCLDLEWQCWGACSQKEKIDCVFVTRIDVFPQTKVFTIYLVGAGVGGDSLSDWLPQAWGLFKRFAQAKGCSSIKGTGRTGWVKVLSTIEANKFTEHYSFSVEV